jgi:3-deoxy-manno-octulosonate cytidylyltransferase (CMP-KDO synthetase)
MRALVVIPARLGSRRLPRKPLALLRGRPLVEHVWRAACRARRPERVVLATDAPEIAAAAAAFGAEAMLTDPAHESGSDRVAEVARRLPEFDVVVNPQGDEPLLPPEGLDAALQALADDPAAAAATLAHLEIDRAAWRNPAVVKLEMDAAGYATGFFREPADPTAVPPAFLRHVGLYAYRRAALLAFAAWPPAPAERAASLEQLRLLAHGRKMRVVVTPYRSLAVDTPHDLARLEAEWERLGPDSPAALPEASP